MVKNLSSDELKEKHRELLSNEAISSVSRATEPNSATQTDEKQYIDKAKSNIGILKRRFKLIIENNSPLKGLS